MRLKTLILTPHTGCFKNNPLMVVLLHLLLPIRLFRDCFPKTTCLVLSLAKAFPGRLFRSAFFNPGDIFFLSRPSQGFHRLPLAIAFLNRSFQDVTVTWPSSRLDRSHQGDCHMATIVPQVSSRQASLQPKPAGSSSKFREGIVFLFGSEHPPRSYPYE